MIFTETLPKHSMELLKKIQQIEEFQNFSLVWWTNLALRYGHRISIDLDLFTNIEFDEESIDQAINTNFTNFKKIKQSKQSLLYYINDTKVDILLYKYKYLNPVQYVDGINMLHTNDIIAMKLSAISMRWSKKDFYDIYELMKNFDLWYMIDLYSQKYPKSDSSIPVIWLWYFDDADKEPNPISLNKTTRMQIKKHINKELDIYIRSKL